VSKSLTEKTEEMALLDCKFDALNSPSLRELNDWRGDIGIIKRAFDDKKRRRFLELNDFASLAPKLDNAESFGCDFVLYARIFCDNYLLRVSFV
jgi:hypothetical protein